MTTPLLYTPPSKGLLRSLHADVRTLVHERLADQLRWYQSLFEADDDEVACQMNACASVIGIRGRKEDVVHAPISAAKIARFKDGKTKPQHQTLDQVTAFFIEKLDAKPFLFWPDMEDVLTGFHDARRYRKERTRKDLIALTKGWIFIDLHDPHCTLALQLSPLNAAPVILVRGRVAAFSPTGDLENRKLNKDAFVHGYGTLTPKNLNLYLRDENRRQVMVTLDVDAGPFMDDADAAPYLVIRHADIVLPPEFGAAYRLPFSNGRQPPKGKEYALHMTELNIGHLKYGQQAIDLIFSLPSKGPRPWLSPKNKTRKI